jgi:uncharacterized membrane protein
VTAEEGASAPEVGLGTERVEAFSDGVIAVIITIMALELKAPATASLSSLGNRFPALLVYVLSFSLVGIYWNNHHHLFRAARRISGAVMWANLHLLFWLSLIPFLTEWIGNEHAHPLPAASYGVVNLMAAIAYTILVQAIIRADKKGSVISQAIGSDVKGKVSLAMFAIAIPLAFASPWISYALYAGVAVMWVVPDRRLSRLLGG